jgi:hypothetical protein
MTDALTNTLDDLEAEVMETLDNPTPSFLIDFPYEVSFSMPQDGHATKVTIETRSETICTAHDEDEVRQELKLHQPVFDTFYVERLMKWLCGNIENVNPSDANVTYGDDYKISPMTAAEVTAFKGDCTDV